MKVPTLMILSLVALATAQLQNMKKLGTANNEFALNLYSKINEDEKGNIFFGPLSISTALAMVHLAAGGNTSSQIEKVMRFESVGANFKEIFQDLNTRLYNRNNNYTLTSANRLFGDQQFSIRDQFLTDADNFYNAGMELVDFKNAAENARVHINDWVKNHTEGKIMDLMPKGSIDASTILVLANALYFKGKWTMPFDPTDTASSMFYTSGNDVGTKMDFMYQKAEFPLLENAGLNVKVLELPYDGDDLSMFIVLPNERTGLTALENAITIDALETLTDPTNFTTSEDIKVWLPKFEIAQSFDLVSTLSAMGMKDLFSSRDADLSGIHSGANLYMSALHHKAFVTINEEGTEAAAATGGGISLTSVQDPKEFKADHPFMFFIREKSTGSIVFLGRVKEQPVTSAVFKSGFYTQDDNNTAMVNKYGVFMSLICVFVAFAIWK
ncbi:unnamed protein product [Owenia fusiformis]|uniref:Uncharacterized protein n=1 Tax=Owenia fusiformis TaxID=6347 RepID=A0A8J1Y9F5_OWEFU|nr:unnamed protein product [Owenia fusiformis]